LGSLPCTPCHTPHGGDTSVSEAPLWNHTLTSTTFTLYSTETLNATMASPDGMSKLCLSCHDGSVKMDAYGGAGGANTITGNALIGVDLSGEHPVSFTYNDALATADGGLNAPTTTDSGLGGKITGDLLSSSKMQCTSCHDVHNGASVAKLLRKSNANDALCTTCHNK
jgi:predicted CXXCH cytochrome family protein